MKIAIGKLADAMWALNEFAATPMPPAYSLRMRRMLKQIRNEVQTYQEVAAETAAKHNGVLKTTPQGVQYFDFGTRDVRQAYEKAMEPAKAKEIEVEVEPWSPEDLNVIAAVKPNVLEALEWLIPL